MLLTKKVENKRKHINLMVNTIVASMIFKGKNIRASDVYNAVGISRQMFRYYLHDEIFNQELDKHGIALLKDQKNNRYYFTMGDINE
ncbi:hypothetical protein [Metabacillus indicus]|uniref:hypothetical protein n=1 Tax=Metabacillus indicus TaxID=246786 RepID=UPI0024908386|nr:hypothetical protein [Metabacillus indicus]